MAILDAQHLADALNRDAGFTTAARWTTGQVVLEPGPGLPAPVLLGVHEGRASAVAARAASPIALRAPSGWDRLRAHGGLQRGFRHGYLVIEHDRVAAMRHWLALARLVDVVAREA